VALHNVTPHYSCPCFSSVLRFEPDDKLVASGNASCNWPALQICIKRYLDMNADSKSSLPRFLRPLTRTVVHTLLYITLFSGDSLVTAVAQQMPSLNQRPSEFERARVPAVETPFEFRRAKEPSMKRSLDGKMDAWRREYVRTRCCTGNARSTSWIFKAIPAVQVCERARIAALPLCRKLGLGSCCRVW
jgi:hypothetical protein